LAVDEDFEFAKVGQRRVPETALDSSSADRDGETVCDFQSPE
jgi:hypothetical protein